MINNNIHNISYWEHAAYFRRWDLIIVGGGIVGLSTGISFLETHPGTKVLILERGILPNGASTKNAGFACFGTAGEILDDLSHIPANSVWKTISMRYEGLGLLRERLGDNGMALENFGGFEIFYDEQKFRNVSSSLPELNAEMEKTCGIQNCFSEQTPDPEKLPGVVGIIANRYEGQIDTGKTMSGLQLLFLRLGGTMVNGVEVSQLEEKKDEVVIHSSFGRFTGLKSVVAINGFASQLLDIEDVKPARAQVLVTSPIKHLALRGTFHYDRGFIYFRNIGNRILLGGARNLDMENETTIDNSLNARIQNHLFEFLQNKILPGVSFKVDHRWTGIMGVGSEKLPIIRKTGARVIAAVRMGGMGIAIGSLVGKRAAELADS